MSFERPVTGVGMSAEPGIPVREADAHDASDAPAGMLSPAMRLQILSTEHWSLLASRSLAWNETFSRAGMFLTTLSGAIVALALVAQLNGLSDGFLLTALVILPVVLFVGVTTLVRMAASNYHDAMCVVGMNRIRHAYLELAPELEPYFVMSSHDDVRGVGITMGVPPGGSSVLNVLAATPSVISVINSVIVAVIASVIGLMSQLAVPVIIALAVAAFLVAMVLFIGLAASDIRRAQAALQPLFPGGPEDRS